MKWKCKRVIGISNWQEFNVHSVIQPYTSEASRKNKITWYDKLLQMTSLPSQLAQIKLLTLSINIYWLVLQMHSKFKHIVVYLSLDWYSMDWSNGCVRNKALCCEEKSKDGFVKLSGMKGPDTTDSWLDETIGLVI